MQRQLQLLTGLAPDRPKYIFGSYVAETAKKLLPQVIEWLGDDFDKDEPYLLTQLERCLDREREWDGYKLTKALDWDGDRDLVEIMDAAGSYRNEAHRAAVKRWVCDYDIKPAFHAGDHVEIEHERERISGEIVSVDLELATYTVHCSSLGHIKPNSDSTGTIGFIVSFESVQPLQPVGPQSIQSQGGVPSHT